ncbi:hypothetical protein F0562_026914 [Nyssa sinensis]|uniref:DUF4220 domain-containing protein n=1 Tax=Nyssa sinensis TaxID=561372 RepID=A0A5J5B3U9_9ASTE|nr:hypothetical protein F0562_026914 [Nyssa sinensis]
MLFTVAGAFMYVENRRLVEVFPDSVKKVWKEWELRAMILLSLSLQIVLVLLGNRRKYMARTWIRIIIWSAYLMADWVATVALGIISRNSQDNCNAPGVDKEASNELMSFWAPFLLLHLGGPDTITAYSLEDNELWLRHLLGLVVQSGVALYIFLLAWPGSSWLPILSIPMLEVGLIKYGERTWALRSANSEHLRDSMLTPPDPGPNYAKFMEELTLKKAEGYYVDAIKGPEDPVPTDDSYPEKEEQLIIKVYDLFQTFKRLFVDLILTFHDLGSSKSFFQKLTSERAFHVVEVELGFAYDILYTKAPVVYTALGCLFRFISISFTLAVLVAFIGLSEKSKYHRIDLIITYLLLVGAVLLEIYAVIVMFYSYWTVHWFSKHKRTRRLLSHPSLRQFNKHMWSNSIAQYNLLSICLEDQKPASVCLGIQRLLQIDKFREKHCYKTYSNVSKELKDLIFKQLVKSTENGSQESPSTLCARRGSFVFKKYNDPERRRL